MLVAYAADLAMGVHCVQAWITNAHDAHAAIVIATTNKAMKHKVTT